MCFVPDTGTWTEDKTCTSGLVKELSFLGSTVPFRNVKIVCDDDAVIVAAGEDNWTGSKDSCSSGICGIKVASGTKYVKLTCC